MLLIYFQKKTPRISYIFKHVCSRILEIDVQFTTDKEEFRSFPGPKFSYGKKPLGDELFFQAHGLLSQQGFETLDISVKKWNNTVGFFPVAGNSALPYDIFSSSFYLLSRYEEYLPHVKDEFGRFMASESLAFKEGFIQQPVVDVWAQRFKEALVTAFPELIFPEKKMVVHPIVDAGQPFAYKQKGMFRLVIGFANDLLNGKVGNLANRAKVIFGLQRDPLDTFKWMINTVKKNNSKLSVFFLLGNALVFEESLNTRRHKFKMLIKFIADYKEVGLIFSFASLTDFSLFKNEKKRLEDIVNRPLSSSMNAQYVVNLPSLYRLLVELEIKKDFTMVYKDTIGFRASTCTPFLFYDIDYEIRTPLVIHPIAMTTYGFQKKYALDVQKTVAHIKASVAAVNGTFSIVYTNKDFSFTEENKVWRDIFSEKN